MKGNTVQTSIDLVIRDKVAEITLIGPEGKPPTIDQDVLESLERVVAELATSDVRLAYLKSNSEKFFCVGANISVLKETNTETIGPWVRNGHRVLSQLEDLPFPVVAIVKGYAMGGGLELAMACDLIFAAENARFAQSEARLGFIPGWGGTRRLVDRVGVAKAKYMFYSAVLLSAVEAVEWGLIDFCGNESELNGHTESFTGNVLDNNRNAITTFKRVLNGKLRLEREQNIEDEALNSVSCLEDADTLKRLNDFLEKKK